VNEMEEEHEKVEDSLTKTKEDVERFEEKVNKFIEEGQGEEKDQKELEDTIERLTKEADEAVEAKREQEMQLKALKKPKNAVEHELKSIERNLKSQKKQVSAAAKKVEEIRKAFLEKQGSASTDKAKNIEEQTKIEEEFAASKEKAEKYEDKIEETLEKYEDVKKEVENLGEDTREVYMQVKEQERLLKELQSGKGGGVAMFGEKAPAMLARVKDAMKKNKVRWCEGREERSDGWSETIAAASNCATMHSSLVLQRTITNNLLLVASLIAASRQRLWPGRRSHPSEEGQGVVGKARRGCHRKCRARYLRLRQQGRHPHPEANQEGHRMQRPGHPYQSPEPCCEVQDPCRDRR